jgi:hypothetical protein
VKKFAIVVVIVLGVLVGVDFGAAAVAEHQVAKRLQTQLELAEPPEVRVNGFPFLTQAVRGDYRDVAITARGLQVGDLSEVGIEANLHHARVALSDVVGGQVEEIPVDRLIGQVRLHSPDIGRMIGVHNLTVRPASENELAGSENGNDQASELAQFTGTVNIAGSSNEVQVLAELSLQNGLLHFQPRKLSLNNSALGQIDLPPVFEESVLNQFATTVDPGQLPFEVTPTAIRVERDVLVVEGTAEDVTLGSGGVSSR